MRMHWKLAGVGLGLFVLGAGAGVGAVRLWGPSDGAPPPEDDSPVVARFEGGVVRAQAVRTRMEQDGPLAAEAYATAEGRERLVRRMVQERVLLAEARARGFHHRPDVARDLDARLLEAYLEETFEAPERQRPVTDAELEQAFRAQEAALARPARVRLAQVLLAAPEGDAAARAAQRRAATELLSEARRALARDEGAFAALARRHSSDPRTRALGGELPPMTEAEALAALGPDVARAAFAEGAPARGLLGEVFEGRDGFRVLVVLEREEATRPRLEDARDVLRPRLQRERRGKAWEAFVAALEQRARPSVDAAELARLAPPEKAAAR